MAVNGLAGRQGVCLYILEGEAPVKGHKCSLPAVLGLGGSFLIVKTAD